MFSSVRPAARRTASAVIHRGSFHLHAGFGFGTDIRPQAVHSDLWQWRGRWRGWRKMSDEGVPAARGVAMVSTQRGIYRFGGLDAEGRYLSDTFLWRDTAWEPVTAIDPPPGRYCCAMACRDDGALIVYGGYGERGPLNDMHVFRHGAWSPVKQINPPSPRHGFGWCADSWSLAIAGGHENSHDLAEVWTLGFHDMTWRPLAPLPEPRLFPAVGRFDNSNSLAVFGGRLKTNPRSNFSDTFIWSCGGWDRHDGPSPGYHAKAAYASGRDGLWIGFGEGPHGHVSDLWKFDRNGWVCLDKTRDDDPVMW